MKKLLLGFLAVILLASILYAEESQPVPLRRIDTFASPNGNIIYEIDYAGVGIDPSWLGNAKLFASIDMTDRWKVLYDNRGLVIGWEAWDVETLCKDFEKTLKRMAIAITALRKSYARLMAWVYTDEDQSPKREPKRCRGFNKAE